MQHRGSHPSYMPVFTDFDTRSQIIEHTSWPKAAAQKQHARQRPRRAKHKPDYTPVPLRAAFLVSFVLLFCVCIALVECLLRKSVTLETYTSTNGSSSFSSSAVQDLKPRHPLASMPAIQGRDDTSTPDDGRPTEYICPEGQPTPTYNIAALQPRSSLCSEFSATYAAQTRNMSYEMQTSLSQFLLSYEAASESGWRYAWHSDCPETNAFGTFYRTIDMVCELTTIVVGYNGCQAGGTASIENFSLIRSTWEVCGVTRNTLIDETATDTVVTQPTYTGQISTTDVINIDAKPLSTITLPNSDIVSPAAIPVSPTPAPTNIADVGAANQDSLSAESVVETVIVAVASVPTTLVAADAQGDIQTIVTQVNPMAAVASPASILVTDAEGVVSTITTIASGASPITILYTDGQGVANTITTQLAGVVMGASATIVTTNSVGSVQTMVVAADQLVAITSTSYTTNAQGQVEASTSVGYGLVGVLTTYVATNPAGQVETVISKIADVEPKYTTTSQYTSMVTTTNADGSISSFEAIVVQTVVLTGTPTVTATRTSTSSTEPTSFVLASHERIVNQKYSSTVYILAMYLPALIAVIIKAMWEMVFAAIKLLEPFERMGTERGTDAQYSIFSQYLSSSFSLDAFNSLAYANPLPLLAGFLYVVVQVFTPLAAASMTIRARDTCDVNGREERCLPTWIVNITLLRVAEAILGVCAIIVLLVLWNAYRRRSGLQSDPSSLAAMAALMTHEPLLRDMQRVDPNADHSFFEEQFIDHYFHLDYHENSNEQQVYGIIGFTGKDSKSGECPDSLPELDIANETVAFSNDKLQKGYKHKYQSVHDSQLICQPSSYQSASFNSRIRKHLVSDICGLLLPFSLLTIILVFYFDDDDTAFNRFFSSDSVTPKFVLVTIATLTSLHLSHVERLVRITEPFRRLENNAPNPRKQRFVPPDTTLLLSRAGTPYSTLPVNILLVAKHLFRPYRSGGRPALFAGGMIFQWLVSLTVILSDLNILAVSGVAYNDAMTWRSYQMSCRVSIVLSGWIVMMYTIFMLWWRRCGSVRYLGGRSISKGVGTVGGLMRWLVNGISDGDEGNHEKNGVIGAVLRVKQEDNWGKWNKKARKTMHFEHEGTQYQGGGGIEDKSNSGETVVWFQRTGRTGADGQESWALMCRTHGLSKVQFQPVQEPQWPQQQWRRQQQHQHQHPQRMQSHLREEEEEEEEESNVHDQVWVERQLHPIESDQDTYQH